MIYYYFCHLVLTNIPSCVTVHGVRVFGFDEKITTDNILTLLEKAAEEYRTAYNISNNVQILIVSYQEVEKP
ncbi:hypothetical protein ELBI_56 [Anabaena phage Elbi]|nr:hypothetical protein ELBI_56 [Anabaena phage Elbi]